MHVINKDIRRPDAALIAEARKTWACLAGGVAGRRFVMDAGLRPLKRGWRIAGPAVTVCPENPADNLASHLAATYCQPGDVLVIDAGGNTDLAAWGATMTWGCKVNGVEGVVIDGAVLTTELLIDYEDVPIFCRGSVPRSLNGGLGPASINVPVVCGGVIVNPGDIILGDEDGIVVLPLDHAAAILAQSGKRSGSHPPASRATKPFNERGFEAKLKAIPGIEWR